MLLRGFPLKVTLSLFLLLNSVYASEWFTWDAFTTPNREVVPLQWGHPPNDQCFDRQEIYLGHSTLVPLEEFAYATPKSSCKSNSTNGLWYTFLAQGTKVVATACVVNATYDNVIISPVINIFEDFCTWKENRTLYPGECTEQCEELHCFASNDSYEFPSGDGCNTVTFNTSRATNYIVYVYLDQGANADGRTNLLNRQERDPFSSGYLDILVVGIGCNGKYNDSESYDACGVCGGNDSSCRGCDGILFSGKKFDACGVCGGNNETCLTGCNSEPLSNEIYDVCGVCGGNGSSCMGCNGVPDPDPETRKRFDQCGVCGGDGMSCADCLGVIGGDAYPDACGVCFGDGTSCADCAGCPNGNATLDRCGVCNGNNRCVGCDDVVNSGLIYDECGVCGGNGSTCLGCDGIPNAVEDACGVCMGDNSTCTCKFYEEFGTSELDCSLLSYTFAQTLNQIDTLLFTLENTVAALQQLQAEGGVPDTVTALLRDEILVSKLFEKQCVDPYTYDMGETLLGLQG